MDEGQTSPNNLLDTTDCLEAVGVFRGWKNFLFLIIILCLLLLQGIFWLVSTGYVRTGGAETVQAAVKAQDDSSVVTAGDTEQTAEEPNQPVEAAKQPVEVVKEPNRPVVTEPQKKRVIFPIDISARHLTLPVRLLNFVLILTAILHCLTMLFSIKVSLMGRLGGINHISRAFFLSLIFLVLLLPWQVVFPRIFIGVMYTPKELLDVASGAEIEGVFQIAVFYLRFTGYWLLVVLLVIFSQIRSARWTKATLRRLEVI